MGAVPASIGHNSAALTLQERLELDYQDLAENISAELIAIRDIPAEIQDDEQNSEVGEAVKRLRALQKSAEDKRKIETEPFLTSQRTVNAFFGALGERLSKARDELEARGKKFLKAKEAAERERRIEAERIAKEEAEKKLREAQAAEESGRLAVADLKLQQAEQAERRSFLAAEAATASQADLARTRLSDGGVSTLKTEWKFEIQDIHEVPLEQIRAFFTPAEVEKAIRGFVRAGGRQLKGVRIYEDAKAQYR